MLSRSSSLLSGVVLNAGSFLTSLHTTDSISAVTFIFLLWRSVTNPPVLHVHALSMLYFALQTHSCGKRLSSHRYLNKTASKNSHLVNEKFSCFNGKDNHIEAPSDVLYNWFLIVILSFWFEGLSESCHKLPLN